MTPTSVPAVAAPAALPVRSTPPGPEAAADWSAVTRLTAGDRRFLAATTGESFPAYPHGVPPELSPLSMVVSAARQTGQLPVGRPVNAAFLADLIAQYPSDRALGAAARRGLELLAAHPSGTSFDADA